MSSIKPSFRGGVNPKIKTVWITQPSQSQFKDNYVVIKKIGEPGQFGKAFQCRRKKDGKVLAVKEISKARIYRLHPSNATRQHLLKSMQAEIDIMRRLQHPYIVNMYETYETKHELHIVMEECKGGELFDRIKTKQRYKEQEAKPIIKMICNALYYMHDRHRVVHCDLKPDNILFVDESEHSDIKIIDFGMSKVLPRLKSLDDLCGTPYYTAPEVISGNYSHAADMWSVGVIAYVMIFGFPPFYVDPNKYYGIKETKAIYQLIMKGFTPTIKKGYGSWFPETMQKNLGEDGRNFIGCLMEADIAKRLTAKEALQHPWLKEDSGERHQSNSPSLSSSHKHSNKDSSGMELAGVQIMNFATSHKFKFAIAALFRDQYERMRPKHFENLRNLFNELDKDGNGKISYTEFEQGMLQCTDLKLSKHKIQQMFKELDVSDIGEIAFDQLLNAAVHDYLVASDVRLYEAFRDLDKNESGKIQTAELKQKIRELNPYDNVDMLLQIIDDVDLDNDGTIDYEEFLKALHPDFSETPNWFYSTSMLNEQEQDDEDEQDEEEEQKSWSSADVHGGQKQQVGSVSRSENEVKLQPVAQQMVNGQKKKKEDVFVRGLNGESIVKQGYMKKEGKLVKSWKRRWFILQRNGIMSYYHNQHENVPIARFNCKSMSRLKYKSWSKSNKKRYGIKVYTAHRNWRFLCENEQERGEWMQILQTISGKKAE